MTFPFISPDWDFALWAVLIAVAGFGFWADSTRIGKQVSGIGIMLVIAMLLGNFGVIPHTAPAYDVVWSYLVPEHCQVVGSHTSSRQKNPGAVPLLVGTRNLSPVSESLIPKQATMYFSNAAVVA